MLSDTHLSGSSPELPARFIEELRGAAMVIHAGDIVDPSVLEKIKTFCPKVLAVYGNMDFQETRKLLPEREIIKIGKYKIGLMHGYGAPDSLAEKVADAFKNDAVDVIIFGHSHTALKEMRKGILLFNPGSLTDRVFTDHNSFGILEINDTIRARIVRI